MQPRANGVEADSNPQQTSAVTLELPSDLAAALKGAGCLQRAYLVGGCVRDAILGVPVKDFDIEVHGVSYEALAAALSEYGRTDLVGRSFGVVKLKTASGQVFDFTVPRRDSKVAPGHKGFEVTFDPDISMAEAAARRDFTINSLLYDPRRKALLDPCGGLEDLRQKRLRHTSPAFAEDPLRVLRGMQFAGRFGLTTAPETVALCREIKERYNELALERVREEWFKWAGQSTVPSCGLRYLAETGWVDHFPEIKSLIGVPQDPEWHPEGDVFTHTCHSCDALARLPEFREADIESRITYMLAVLAHDFAKPQTTQEAMREGRLRIVSPGHEEAGAVLAERFLSRMNAPKAIVERVLPLVCNHLAHLQISTDRSVRRLAKRLEPETIAGLCTVITADQFGRPPMPCVPSQGLVELRRKAAELALERAVPKPILMGRHLLEHGMLPGPAVGQIVAAAYDAQLEGMFGDLAGAWNWLTTQRQLPVPQAVRAWLKEPQ